MREPVRSAPPPPAGGRPASIIRRGPEDTIVKRSVLDAVGGPGLAPPRPSRGPRGAAPAPAPAQRRQGVRPPPKKKPPPRPPPPKFQEFSTRHAPPSYEQVLREDAAALAGFGVGSGSSSGSVPRAGDDLIDFDAPAPPPPRPVSTVPATWEAWDAPATVPRTFSAPALAPAAAPAPAPAPARAQTPSVTVIRPAKAGGAVARGLARLRASAAAATGAGPGAWATDDLGGDDASPPMPSCPPPPPPPVAELDCAPAVRPPTPPPRPGSSASGTEGPQATALYDYHSAEADDLSFDEGEVIQLLERVDGEWLRGRCGRRQGMFPAVYVQVTVPLPGEVEQQEAGPSQENGYTALALYDFAAQEAQDLPLTAGDPVSVQGRLNDEWGYGTAGGRTGQFPLSFVDLDPAQLPLL